MNMISSIIFSRGHRFSAEATAGEGTGMRGTGRARRGTAAMIAVVLAVLGLGASACTNSVTGDALAGPGRSRMIDVVAAENFWGSLASQLGGAHVRVFSIVSNPNADPHDYESSALDARAVAAARYVIQNGVGYDGWM